MLPRTYINSGNCSIGWRLGDIDMPSGIDCLDYYSKKEDASTGVIKDVPVHNQYSHGCDSLRTLVEARRLGMIEGTSYTTPTAERGPPKVVLAGWNSSRSDMRTPRRAIIN